MIKHYLRKHLANLVRATLLSTVSAVLAMSLLTHLNRVALAGIEGSKLSAVLMALGLVAATLLTNVASYSFTARLTAEIVSGVRLDLSRRFLALDYERLLATGKHVVTGALIEDVTRVSYLLLALAPVTYHVISLVFCLGYLAFLAPRLFVVFVLLAGAVGATSFLIVARVKRRFDAIREDSDKLYEHFRALAEGKKELTLNDRRAHHFLEHVLGAAIGRNRDFVFGAHKWMGYAHAWATSMIFLALFAVVFAGQGLFSESPTTIMQFVIVALFMMGPFNGLVTATGDFSAGLASVRHLESVGLDHDDVPKSLPVSRAIGSDVDHWQKISAHALEYRYTGAGDDAFKFGPVDFDLHRGETVFVVGGNGSGKSTLALLMGGLVQATTGRIEVDGKTVDADGRDAYRTRFTGVFYDFHLFSHVIDRDGNLASDAAVNDLLEKFDIGCKVTAAGGILSTLNLSQGQRKRLALAQSCLDDRDIYLFDELAADQDQEFRDYFYRELLPELKRKGKTVLAVTHDDRFFAMADRIVKLEQGRVVGQ